MINNKLIKIGFGGGCHWCTEAVFQSLKGVDDVQQGYISTSEEPETFYEGILLKFDPVLIDLKTLIDIHLKTHQSTSNHSFRHKYLSAIYTMESSIYQRANEIIKNHLDNGKSDYITRVVYFGKFKSSRPQIQNYYKTDPERPFCRKYIDPKLDLLKSDFAEYLDQ